MEWWLTWRRACNLTVWTVQKHEFGSVTEYQLLATDEEVVLALSNPLNWDFLLVTSNIQESGVRYRDSKDSPLNFQYSLFTVLEMGYGELLGKTAVKLLLIILPCHAFKLNIFWATHNKKLKPLEGISETRYTEKKIFVKIQEKILLRKNCYQTERNWVFLL